MFSNLRGDRSISQNSKSTQKQKSPFRFCSIHFIFSFCSSFHLVFTLFYIFSPSRFEPRKKEVANEPGMKMDLKRGLQRKKEQSVKKSICRSVKRTFFSHQPLYSEVGHLFFGTEGPINYAQFWSAMLFVFLLPKYEKKRKHW